MGANNSGPEFRNRGVTVADLIKILYLKKYLSGNHLKSCIFLINMEILLMKIYFTPVGGIGIGKNTSGIPQVENIFPW